MLFEIKNFYTKEIMFSVEAENWGSALETILKNEPRKRIVHGFYGADLSGLDLSGVSFYGVNLTLADLSRTNLSNANLRNCILNRTILINSNLKNADLFCADLDNAFLMKADLTGANLTGANLFNASLHNSILEGEIIQRNPIQINDTILPIMILKNKIRIGTELHSAEEWFSFSDVKILMMNLHKSEDVLSWWTVWKPIIKSIHDYHVSSHTGGANG